MRQDAILLISWFIANIVAYATTARELNIDPIILRKLALLCIALVEELAYRNIDKSCLLYAIAGVGRIGASSAPFERN